MELETSTTSSLEPNTSLPSKPLQTPASMFTICVSCGRRAYLGNGIGTASLLTKLGKASGLAAQRNELSTASNNDLTLDWSWVPIEMLYAARWSEGDGKKTKKRKRRRKEKTMESANHQSRILQAGTEDRSGVSSRVCKQLLPLHANLPAQYQSTRPSMKEALETSIAPML